MEGFAWSMREFLKGKKTYLMGILGIAWAVYGWATGYIDAVTAQGIIWGALTTMAIRAGIAKTK